jgi:hypothetical protein
MRLTSCIRSEFDSSEGSSTPNSIKLDLLISLLSKTVSLFILERSDPVLTAEVSSTLSFSS